MNKLSALATLALLFLVGILVGNSAQARGGGNWIEITQGEQQLRVYSANGTVLFTTPVITGRNALPTPRGVFYIQRLQVTTNPANRKNFKPEFLNGRWNYYRSYVWAPISSSGVGIHDADWWPSWRGRLSYAQHIRATGQGSHGCINVPPSRIWQLRRYMYPGMKVVIN